MKKSFCDAIALLGRRAATHTCVFEGFKMLGEFECGSSVGKQLKDATNITPVFVACGCIVVHADGIPFLPKDQVHRFG